MLLLELLETVLAWRWTLEEPSRCIASFKTPKNQLTYHVEFQREEEGWEFLMEIDPRDLERRGLSPHASMGITKSGEELAVFSTLLAIVRAFIDQYQPDRLVFDAEVGETGSRIRLFDRMFRRIPGYDLHEGNIDEDGFKHYELVYRAKMARAA